MKALEGDDVAAAQTASDRFDAGLARIQQRQKEEAAAKAKAKQDKRKKTAGREKEPARQ